MLINHLHENTGNLGHYEKTKPKNNKNTGRRRSLNQWHRIYFQQNHRRNFLNQKKEILIKL